MYDHVCYLTVCVSVCPDGFYGEDCLEQCECRNGGHCNHETGTCECQAGWHGRMCEKGRTCTRIHRHLVTGHIVGLWQPFLYTSRAGLSSRISFNIISQLSPFSCLFCKHCPSARVVLALFNSMACIITIP